MKLMDTLILERSHGIRNVEKDLAHVEALREMLAQSSHAERLGGVVSGGDEVQAGLARLRHRALLGLAGEQRVRTGGRRVGEEVGARA